MSNPEKILPDRYNYAQRVNVFNVSGKYRKDWPPEKAPEFLAFFATLLEKVPEEYRDAVKIGFGSESGYDDSTDATLEVYYYRPPTEVEVASRKKEDEDRAKQQLAYAEANYLRLKKQLGKE